MKVCVNKFFLIIDLLAVAEPEIPLPPLNPDNYLKIILCATNIMKAEGCQWSILDQVF